MNSLPDHRVLVIDDNPSIHQDFRKILCAEPPPTAALDAAEAALFGQSSAAIERAQFRLDSAYQGQEGLQMVRKALEEGQPYAMAFVDVRMPPGWDGIETITHIWRQYPELQVVICTAYSDYSWDQIVRQLGKTDSMVILKKPFDNVEVLQLVHALTKKWLLAREAKVHLEDLDRLIQQRTSELQHANEELHKEIAERGLVENALRLSEERFSKAFRASPISLAILDLQGDRYVDANDSFLSLTGFKRQEVMSKTAEELALYVEPAQHQQLLARLRETKSIRNQNCRFRTRTGSHREVLVSMEPFDLGMETDVLVILQDITDRLNLETQLRQAQKMEAVGELAAGVAHDFNNILTIIQGHASLVLARANLGRQMTESLKQVSIAAERAAALTRRLLAFSRKQVLQPKIADLNELIRHLTDMLRRLIGEHVTLECQFSPCPLRIFADASGIEQVLVNLAVNARDSMAKGGQLRIAASDATLGAEAVGLNPEAKPGHYARVDVTDTGCGMTPEVLPRIFEPFFTTKDVGRGTGLGLATVYGILKQHGGWIEATSQPGKGSTFTFYLPLTQRPVEVPQPAPTKGTHAGQQEHVLIVEDEDPVREMICEVLQDCGYQVLAASDGQAALRLWQNRQRDIDLLLTDMVMPNGMSGRALATRLLADNPALKVVYTTGYSMELSESLDHENVHFLPKPFDIETLTRTVRRCLDGHGNGKANPVGTTRE